MAISIFVLLAGLGLLVISANWLVDYASALAKKYNISDLAIGLTVVAFGTSMPELIVNIVSAINNHQDIAMGNIIGSNNFNLFVILGISGIITPLTVKSSTVWKEIPFSLLAAVLLLIMANDLFLSSSSMLGRIDGFIFLAFFVAFLYYVFLQMQGDDTNSELATNQYSFTRIILMIIVALAGLIVGGKLVVDMAVKIASGLGISEKVIGLTIIAAGTSMPEMMTSIVAAIKKNNDIAIGNIMGSNIFNIFMILGTSTLIRSIVYTKNFNIELIMLISGTIFLFIAMFTGEKKKLDRWEAAILLIAFIGYTTFTIAKI
ncbi:MAG: calcium/sodium antiporter [Candidatus Marinimicrobia bacterium]|nr:calcium/sodium antiporter [Candidatus Neomarinimicrobiota bacterium]